MVKPILNGAENLFKDIVPCIHELPVLGAHAERLRTPVAQTFRRVSWSLSVPSRPSEFGLQSRKFVDVVL